jgi:hypothetical protein
MNKNNPRCDVHVPKKTKCKISISVILGGCSMLSPTTLPIGYSSCRCWETFTLNGVSSSFLSHISTTRGFENMVASFAMIRSPTTSTKNKIISKMTNLILAFERGLMFLFWKSG